MSILLFQAEPRAQEHPSSHNIFKHFNLAKLSKNINSFSFHKQSKEGGDYYYPQFTNKKTKAQRIKENFPVLHIQ